MFPNLICFHGEELLAPRPTPKPQDLPFSAVRDYLFNMFAATLHIGVRSSIRNLRTHHAVVRETDLPVFTHCKQCLTKSENCKPSLGP